MRILRLIHMIPKFPNMNVHWVYIHWRSMTNVRGRSCEHLQIGTTLLDAIKRCSSRLDHQLGQLPNSRIPQKWLIEWDVADRSSSSPSSSSPTCSRSSESSSLMAFHALLRVFRVGVAGWSCCYTSKYTQSIRERGKTYIELEAERLRREGGIAKEHQPVESDGADAWGKKASSAWIGEYKY